MALYDLVDWKYPDRENPIKYAGSEYAGRDGAIRPE